MKTVANIFFIFCFQVILVCCKSCSNINVISRDSWGARPPTHHSTLNGSVHLFFIHHTAEHECYSVEECSKELQNIQNYHMDSRGFWDIGYNFLIGNDGQVYEGRGWSTVGAHTLHYNSIAYAASFMGNYMDHLPPSRSLAAADALIQCGIDEGYIEAGYSLYGHRDVGNTACPGTALYREIKTWVHYNQSKSSIIA